MNHSKMTVLFLLVGTVCLVSHQVLSEKSPPKDTDTIRIEVLQASERGSIKARATAIIRAPRERVWQEATNYSHIATGRPHVVYDGKDSNAPSVVRFDLRFPWPLSDRDLTLAFIEHHELYTFEWHKIDGSIRNHSGKVVLEDHGDYTVVTLIVEQETGFFVPNFLVRRAIFRKITNEIWRVRLYLDGHIPHLVR